MKKQPKAFTSNFVLINPKKDGRIFDLYYVFFVECRNHKVVSRFV